MKRKFLIEFDRTPDHAIDYLLGIFEDTRIVTLQRAARMSVEELDWQYRPGWNTIGALLSHVTALEHFFRIEFIEGRKLTEAENEKWLPGLDLGEYVPQLITGEPVENYIARLEESRRLFLKSFEALSFEDFAERREGYDEETGCNLAWVLYHLAEDEIYHRGQISFIQKLRKEISGAL